MRTFLVSTMKEDKFFIESVYNEKRLHSKIGYLLAIEFEEALILYSVA